MFAPENFMHWKMKTFPFSGSSAYFSGANLPLVFSGIPAWRIIIWAILEGVPQPGVRGLTITMILHNHLLIGMILQVETEQPSTWSIVSGRVWKRPCRSLIKIVGACSCEPEKKQRVLQKKCLKKQKGFTSLEQDKKRRVMMYGRCVFCFGLFFISWTWWHCEIPKKKNFWWFHLGAPYNMVALICRRSSHFFSCRWGLRQVKGAGKQTVKWNDWNKLVQGKFDESCSYLNCMEGFIWIRQKSNL